MKFFKIIIFVNMLCVWLLSDVFSQDDLLEKKSIKKKSFLNSLKGKEQSDVKDLSYISDDSKYDVNYGGQEEKNSNQEKSSDKIDESEDTQKDLSYTSDSQISSESNKANSSISDSKDEKSKEDLEIEKLEKELNKLRLINSLNKEKNKKKLQDLLDQTEEINSKVALEKAKLNQKISKLEAEKNLILTEIELIKAKNKLKQNVIIEETQGINKELELAEAKLKKKLVELNHSKDEIDAKMSLAESEVNFKLKDHLLEKLKNETDLELSKSKFDLVQESLRQEYEKNKLKKDLLNNKKESLFIESQVENFDKIALLKSKLELLKNENNLQEASVKKSSDELKLLENNWKKKIQELSQNITYKEKIQESEMYINEAKIPYLKEPLVDKALHISDRRISLNGPIMMSTSNYVTERIHFYNNKSKEYPIFIVIDYSPGGSVLSGFRILKAIETSDAPVYVVVKTFAASMAAAITTYADRSFAYPNAIILHHQMSYMAFGNVSEHKDQKKFMDETWKRLVKKITKKMGVSNDEFIKKMYEKFSDGDWMEYADNAKKINWVTDVIDEIREDKFVKNPDFAKKQLFSGTILGSANDSSVLENLNSNKSNIFLKEQIDDTGAPYMFLPRPKPFDFYYLYNPDNYYRVR